MRYVRNALIRAGLACAALGCTADPPLTVRSDAPMVYLVLTADSLEAYEPTLRAVVANTATPVRVEYRTAERFVMRRLSDAAAFDWQQDVASGDTLPSPRGNYVLAESATARGLGRRDLAAGESYVLDLLLDGHVVSGMTTIPERPRPVLITRADGRREVAWQRIPAAGLYRLEVASDFEHDATTTDTSYVLRDDIDWPADSPSQPFRITALDTNWTRYLADSTRRSAGLEGAYGLFGSRSSATIGIPPRG